MNRELSVVATGDSFITMAVPENGYEGFRQLSGMIKNHDVRFSNLEITIHEGEGYPAAVSGGTWAMASPPMLDSLCRYGFNLFSTANNHALDYGHGGLLATIRNLKKRNLAFSGTGRNLAEAAAPVYLETENGRVALISASSTFHEASPAGAQRCDMIGRPGLNPLGYTTVHYVEKEDFEALKRIADNTLVNAKKNRMIRNGFAASAPEDSLNLGDLLFKPGSKMEMRTEAKKRDADRILSSVKEAKRQADIVLVSIHSHEDNGYGTAEPAEFMKTFSRACIDAGANVVIGHGPHEVRGIELYKESVIFYSLGNFIFESDTVLAQPADAYTAKNIPDNVQVGEYMDIRSGYSTKGYCIQPDIWRSIAVSWKFKEGKIKDIKIYPLSLGMECPRSQRGIPKIAQDISVLEHIRVLSEVFGTEIIISGGVGEVVIS